MRERAVRSKRSECIRRNNRDAGRLDMFLGNAENRKRGTETGEVLNPAEDARKNEAGKECRDDVQDVCALIKDEKEKHSTSDEMSEPTEADRENL